MKYTYSNIMKAFCFPCLPGFVDLHMKTSDANTPKCRLTFFFSNDYFCQAQMYILKVISLSWQRRNIYER